MQSLKHHLSGSSSNRARCNDCLHLRRTCGRNLPNKRVGYQHEGRLSKTMGKFRRRDIHSTCGCHPSICEVRRSTQSEHESGSEVSHNLRRHLCRDTAFPRYHTIGLRRGDTILRKRPFHLETLKNSGHTDGDERTRMNTDRCQPTICRHQVHQRPPPNPARSPSNRVVVVKRHGPMEGLYLGAGASCQNEIYAQEVLWVHARFATHG